MITGSFNFTKPAEESNAENLLFIHDKKLAERYTNFVTGLFKYLGCGRTEYSHKEFPVAIPLDPNQIVTFQELLMSQVVQQEVLTRLLVEKGIFSKEGFLNMVRVINREMKRIEK